MDRTQQEAEEEIDASELADVLARHFSANFHVVLSWPGLKRHSCGQHYRFNGSSSPRPPLTPASRLMSRVDLLHCDNQSWFGHIEASAIGFPAWA